MQGVARLAFLQQDKVATYISAYLLAARTRLFEAVFLPNASWALASLDLTVLK